MRAAKAAIEAALAQTSHLDAARDQAREEAATLSRTLEEVRAALHQDGTLAEERTARVAALEAERDREREGRGQAEAEINALKIEAAEFTERAADVDELRALVQTLQEQRN